MYGFWLMKLASYFATAIGSPLGSLVPPKALMKSYFPFACILSRMYFYTSALDDPNSFVPRLACIFAQSLTMS